MACDLGDIGEGELVIVTLRALTAGSWDLTVTAESDAPEANPADNVVLSRIDVAA